jgi:hypothetical protein
MRIIASVAPTHVSSPTHIASGFVSIALPIDKIDNATSWATVRITIKAHIVNVPLHSDQLSIGDTNSSMSAFTIITTQRQQLPIGSKPVEEVVLALYSLSSLLNSLVELLNHHISCGIFIIFHCFLQKCFLIFGTRSMVVLVCEDILFDDTVKEF